MMVLVIRDNTNQLVCHSGVIYPGLFVLLSSDQLVCLLTILERWSPYLKASLRLCISYRTPISSCRFSLLWFQLLHILELALLLMHSSCGNVMDILAAYRKSSKRWSSTLKQAGLSFQIRKTEERTIGGRNYSSASDEKGPFGCSFIYEEEQCFMDWTP